MWHEVMNGIFMDIYQPLINVLASDNLIVLVVGFGQYVHFIGWPSPISLAQNFFEFSWSTGYKNTFILNIGWNFAWLSTFSRQKVKIWHSKGKIYLNLISNLNFSSVFTPNSCLCLLVQFDTKISKYVWFIAKKYCIENIYSQSTFLGYILKFFQKKFLLKH